MFKRPAGLFCFATLLVAATLPAAGNASHIVVVVWDGMRPDFIAPEYAPVLSQMASNGVFFANHHAVYCTATEVNGTAIATGAYPAHSGIIANSMYLPALDTNQPSFTALPKTVAEGDRLTGGKYLARPTVAETLQAAGQTTAIAGAKTVALLQDRHERPAAASNICVFGDSTLPAAAITAITNQIGVFPTNTEHASGLERDEWTRRALTEVLWSNSVPAYSLLWLSEPDATQHPTGPGSDPSLAAINGCDQQLAAVLAELDRRKLRDQTDVLVVSDHGFSTIDSSVDVAAALGQAGFKAFRKFTQPPQNGDILVIGQGGSDLFYVIGHEPDVTRRLVQFLQQQDFSGVIFSEKKLPGTFPLAAAHIDRADNSPDVVLSLRWSADPSSNGTPGLFFSDGGHKSGGNHASLSHFDLHNTLVAAGPDFRRGFVDETPTANTDLAPTILHLLGVKPKVPMDGRVLSEALTVPAPKASHPTNTRLETGATNGVVVWHQYLQTSTVNKTVYLDEGNGSTRKLE